MGLHITKKIWMIEIPRNASSSFDEIFCWNRKPLKTNQRKFNPPSYIKHCSYRMCKHECPRFKEFKNYFKFCVIRNPWDRAVSLFNFFINYPIEPKRLIDSKKIENSKSYFNFWFLNIYGPMYSIFDSDKVYSKPKYWMFYPQYLYYVDDDMKVAVDKIVRLENMNKELEFLNKKFNTNYKLNLVHKSTNKKLKKYQDYYNKKTIDYSFKLFQNDLNYNNYEF